MLDRALVLLATFIAGCALAACSSSSLDLAPASPTTPYRGQAGAPAPVIQSADFAVASDPGMPIDIKSPKLDQHHAYSLPELIDIAQMSSPATRAAWERAREAAAATGVAKAVYLPIITADVVAGLAVTSATAPGLQTRLINIPSGTLTTSGAQAVPAIAIQWLLFDFGARDAALEIARQVSFAANVGFNGTHQRLIFDVSNAYYQHAASTALSTINDETLKNAKVVLAAAEARRRQGLGTVMEVTQAKQVVAQAEFDVTQASGQERSTYALLLGSMGISPTLSIKVQGINRKALPRQVPGSLDTLIVSSLRRRADIQAAFATMKASEQGILAAKAAFLPKVVLSATGNVVLGSYSVHDSRLPNSQSLDVSQPNAGVLLGVSVPIFDGGQRKSRLDSAGATAAAATYDFARLQTTAAQEIAVAYDVLRTNLSGYFAATKLVEAGRTNYEAALEYYQKGLGTLPDVSVAQSALLKARYAQVQARSNAFAAAAALAFAMGTLTSAHGL